jgi:hyaluronate lyase
MVTVYGNNAETYRDYWNNVDQYRYPGVTLDTRERTEHSIAQANEFLSSEDYVGGLSDGICGLASMNLESYHSDGKLISSRFFSPDGAYGYPPPARECSLKGYKSWFFDNGIAVCLGCGIRAHDGAEVITVVDSRKTADGSQIEVQEDSVYISDFGGYYFPVGQKFAVDVQKRNGIRFCDIILSHGVDPRDASYSYVVLPGFSREELTAFRHRAAAEIAANDRRIQAVVFEDGTEEYAFRESACLNGIIVSRPVLVMKRGGRISVADPTHKLDSVSVGCGGAEHAFDLRDSFGKTITKDLEAGNSGRA